MNSSNIPPFVTSMCTPIALHVQLQKLHAWVRLLRDWTNIEAKRLEAPTSPFVPELPPLPRGAESLMVVGIPSLTRSWMTIRAIRERWDWIVRNYEADWDSEKCIFSRILCVQVGALVLFNAYLDPERYEARQEEYKRGEQLQMIEQLRRSGLSEKLLEKMGIVSGLDADEIQFDDLFNPEDGVR